MYLLPSLLIDEILLPMNGQHLERGLIATSKTYEGCTMIEFSIFEPSSRMKICTLTYIQSLDSPVYLVSQMENTLIEDYMRNGRNFGQAVTQTIRLHFPQAHCLSVTY